MTFGCIGDGKADDTDGVQKHFDYGVPLPEGRFRILRPIVSKGPNKRLSGQGRRRTTLTVANDFPAGKEGIVWVKHPGCEVTDFGVSFDQQGRPAPQAYPPAILLQNATQVSRCEVSRILIESAWKGIVGDCNVGGLFMSDIECGAFHTGISIDGALDAVFIDRVNCWPFGFAGSPLYEHYKNGRPIGIHIGKADALHLGSVSMFQCAILFDGQSAGAVASNVVLDGRHANLIIRGNRVNITSLYSSSDDPEDTHIQVERGVTNISTYRLAVSPRQTAPMIHVTGGVLGLGNGAVLIGKSGDVLRQEGGRVILTGMQVVQQPNDERTDWYLHHTGGSLIAVGCTANQQAPGISSNAVKAILGPSDSLTGCVWPGMKCEIEEA